MLVERARLKMRLRDWAGALEDFDRARQLPGGKLLAAAPRTECLHQLGRHAEATRQWRELLADAGENSDDLGRAQLLNGFAYACAVGNLDLDEALVAVDEAIALSVQETALLDPEGVYFAARADIERELGRMSAALASYVRAGKSAAEVLRRETLRYEALKNSDDSLAGSADEYARRVATLRPHLAGILRERAELYEELEKPAEAKRDRETLDSLSQDGNLSVAVPLTWAAATQALSSNAAILDTRGWVHYHRDQLEEALQDTDHAVECAEWHLKATDWMEQVNRHSTIDLRRQAEARHELSRGVAVIRYHRMLVLEKMDRMKRAADDRARIEQLGFEPNDDLF
jgi:tetratricopeptide (TPR) repeat protein